MMGGGLWEHLNRQRLWYSDRRGMKNLPKGLHLQEAQRPKSGHWHCQVTAAVQRATCGHL